ncbi:phosphate signaling complex protein PhoU [Aureimonas phyllosphaerae]|uniref:Phosphate-specific transport system accessory protein PhoU n=1 Tax=Aureimonas phyllosphaerae TaxID=1166078 RepID=A0A7W6FSB3_9HYPH|nr:phosphate signaling complex protein PhoU [Aureimonas phyllosphaerae]MBB3933959.1 phosphate transport system protein [Aureimonas phyllosphaerae]MBB3958825.1 phosphate transport system protein [Aureimonas phyllosphaerae]SFF19896.1 phosphate uptake regulator, PhoU [Aureimonas phyllosphaerae]
MEHHIVTSYDEELKFILRRISEMGGQAERMVEQAVSALIRSDAGLAQSVVADDVLLDAAQREIDEHAIMTIGKRQPMAHDLREIVGAIRISNDLERIGDLGKNIAKRVLATQEHTQPVQLVRGIEHMSELALGQLKEVLDAYATRDHLRAEAIRRGDQEIDALYTSIFRELLTYMMEDPRNITACTHLLFSAKNIERIGDHATNIAETIFYIKTGSQMEIERPKGDSTPTLVAPVGLRGA